MGADFVLFALWGVCKAVVLRDAGTNASRQPDDGDPLVARVVDVIDNGLRPR